jgi:predicted DNA-binding protein with PD1-like motif
MQRRKVVEIHQDERIEMLSMHDNFAVSEDEGCNSFHL